MNKLRKETKNQIAKWQLSRAKDLKTMTKEVCAKELSKEYSKGLIDSMPRRLKEVIKRGGVHTKH